MNTICSNCLLFMECQTTSRIVAFQMHERVKFHGLKHCDRFTPKISSDLPMCWIRDFVDSFTKQTCVEYHCDKYDFTTVKEKSERAPRCLGQCDKFNIAK